MKKDRVIELIHGFFKEIDWKYDYDEEKTTFHSGISMGNVIGNLSIVIYVRERYYKVYAILSNKADEEHLAEVAEYLHGANYDLNNGNFELDYRDGEVRYKVFTEFQGIEFSKRVVENSIIIPILMFDKYGKSLIKAMVGNDTPEKLLKEAEEDNDDNT